MWASVQVKATGLPPLTAEKMRARLRIDDPAEDDLLDAFLAAATAEVDGPDGIGVAMLAQTWTLTLEKGAREIILPGWPVTGVTEMRYREQSGDMQTLDAAAVAALFHRGMDSHGNMRLFARRGVVLPAVSSGPGAIEIDYTLGHAPDAVPAPLVAAVSLLVGHYYENREATAAGPAAAEIPLGVTNILSRYRRGVVA